MLTISIPTYNRSGFLDFCLRRISEEIASLDEGRRCFVKVYVSDNASPDDTPEIIAQYQESLGDAFGSVRNDKNKGPDYNITQCYESATTPYVWIVGDDDVLLPGGLGMVLDVLLNKDIDILYVNNYWFKDSYTQKPSRQGKVGIFKFSNSLGFARRTNVMLTFISGLVVRSGVGQKYRSELMESNLVQLSWVLPLLRDGKNFATVENWVVAAKEGNSGGYGLAQVFGDNLAKATETILKDKPELVRIIQNGTIVNFFPGFVLRFRKGNKKFKDQDMAAGLKKAFGKNWRYYVFLAPVLRMPLLLSRYYYFFIVLLRRYSGPLWA